MKRRDILTLVLVGLAVAVYGLALRQWMRSDPADPTVRFLTRPMLALGVVVVTCVYWQVYLYVTQWESRRVRPVSLGLEVLAAVSLICGWASGIPWLTALEIALCLVLAVRMEIGFRHLRDRAAELDARDAARKQAWIDTRPEK